jgi:hypothetical protein
VRGMAAIKAPAHQINGQWGQVAPTTLEVAVHPYPLDNSGRACYQVMVSNPGHFQEVARLQGSSTEKQLNFQFDPAQITLPPQSQVAANLVVWLATALAAGPPSGVPEVTGPQALDFWVTARPVDTQTQPGHMKASFIRPAPPLKKWPNWLIPTIIIAILLLCAGVVIIIYYLLGY